MNTVECGDSPILRRSDRGAVAILAMNRPTKLNALSNELLAAIVNELDRIELDLAVRVVVITGAGRVFSAGADIAGFQPHMRAGPQQAVVRFMRPGHQMTRRVESFPKPIIAAVNGLAFGGGCELVESTHIALAADTATFSKAENWNYTDLWWNTALAPQYWPESRHRVNTDRTNFRRSRGGAIGSGESRRAEYTPAR